MGERPAVRALTRNTAGLLAARCAVALAGLLSLPVILAELGSVEFGIWVLLTGLAALVAMADLGLGSAIVRQVALGPGGPDSARTGTALVLGLLWGLLFPAAVIAAVMAGWSGLSGILNFGDESGPAMWAAVGLLAGVMVDAVALPWRGVLEGAQRYGTLAWINGGTALLGAGLAVAAVVAGAGLGGLAVSVVLAAVIRSGLLIGLARPEFRSAAGPGLPRPHRLRWADVRPIFGYGMRVQVTTVSGAVNLELDRFVLSGFFGPAVAGGFDLGGRVAGLLRLAPTFLLAALFPMAVSQAAQRGRGWLDDFAVSVTKYVAAFAALGAACLVVCADPLMRLWLGEPNVWAAVNLAILAPAYAINLMAGTTGVITRVDGRPGRETGYALVSLVVNLALTWPLLTWLGPAGVPLATAVAVVVSTIHFVVSYHRATRRPVRPLIRVTWPSVVAATLGAAAGALVLRSLPPAGDRLSAAVAVAGAGCTVLLVAGLVLVPTGFLNRPAWAVRR